jgi:transcriptional antiterminator RfaH
MARFYGATEARGRSTPSSSPAAGSAAMLDAAATAASHTRNRGAPSAAACGSQPPAPWITCQTHPQAERWAVANLTRQGYQAYLPLITIRRRDPVLHTLNRLVEVPLWRGYLFVQLSTASWSPIRSTRGIARVLMSGDKPHHLNAATLEAIRAGDELRRTVTLPDRLWRPGVACQVKYGPLQSMEAVVIAITNQVAHVALLMFGQLREVTISADCLAPRE